MTRSLRFRAGIASFAVLFLAVILTIAWKATNASAENIKVAVTKIDYEKSTLTIKGNAQDTEIYFSDKSGKKWEAVPGKLASDKTITMDISWIPVSSNYTIKFKGNHSEDVVTVVIPKQQTTFKVKYNRVKQEVTYTNKDVDATVQWRKKDSYIWHAADSSFAVELEKLSSQGATVYLRVAPFNGEIKNGVLNPGHRASKEVTITIPKKAEAPVITVDGSKFSVPMKKNSSYRVVDDKGVEGDWQLVTTASDLMLSTIAPDALYVKDTAQKEVTLQFMINATSTAVASRITTVTIPVQAGPPNLDTCGISLEYTSSSSLDLTVKSASTTQPYEYTIVEPDETFDYQHVTWTSITSSAKVSIKEDKAKQGSHIYVRKKSIAKTDKVDFQLASKEVDVTGSTGVKYPNAASVDSLTTLVTTAGTVNADDSSSYLTFTIKSPTKTTVSSIKFKDIYGETKGTVSTVKSTVAPNARSLDSTDNYIITTKITSTSSIDSITEEELFGTIVMANGEEVVSNEDGGIKLYIYPKTVVNNKDDKTYTSSFERVFCSIDAKNDPQSFKFNLDFGKMYEYDRDDIKESTEQVKITKMTYDGYELTSSDYEVVYDDKQFDSDHKPMLKGLVTVNVSKFEKNQKITKRNVATPLIIYLSNGEKLEKEVTIKLVETATIETAPIAYSITEGSLEETKTETVVNEDKSTSSVTKEVVTFTLKLNIFSSTYDVGISDVTWDGVSIMKSAEISGGVATVYLSNPKINKLTTTDSSKTANVEITMSNGYVIEKGCKLTILKKN